MSVLLRHRLAVGVAPRDAGRGFRAAPIDVAIDRPVDSGHAPSPWPRGSGRRTSDGLLRFTRHDSGLHTLLADARFNAPLTIRLVDEARRWVPRKLQVNWAPGTTVRLEPTLFPGAAYDTNPRATAVRGRVVDGVGAPVRWARIEARRVTDSPGIGIIVGHAHGDDRGDFLLLIEPDLVTQADLPRTVPVELTGFVPAAAPVPVPSYIRLNDPYWDVPVEPIPDGATVSNPALSGIQRPPVYTLFGRATVNVELGFLNTRVEIVVP